MSNPPATFLSWDTDFFGHRIAHANSNRLSAEGYEALETWCTKNQIDCLYFLADSDHQPTISVLESNQFHFVDIRVILETRLSNPRPANPPANIVLRLSTPADTEPLLSITSNAYTQSRFYADSCFSRETCSQLYETWLRNSIETDYADAVVVAELDHTAVGYVTCHLNKPDGEGNIGLVGVVETARGQRVGSQMIDYALNWFADHNMQAVNVVTQGRNISAQRLYQHSGFITRSVQVWYHKWFTNCGE